MMIRDTVEDVIDGGPGLWLLLVLMICMPVLLFFMIRVALEEQAEWEKFKVEHQCKIVGRMSGDVFNTVGVTGNGQVAIGIGTTSSKTGYACDDGVTYWR